MSPNGLSKEIIRDQRNTFVTRMWNERERRLEETDEKTTSEMKGGGRWERKKEKGWDVRVLARRVKRERKKCLESSTFSSRWCYEITENPRRLRATWFVRVSFTRSSTYSFIHAFLIPFFLSLCLSFNPFFSSLYYRAPRNSLHFSRSVILFLSIPRFSSVALSRAFTSLESFTDSPFPFSK